jgi:hypothetical protein
MPGVSSNDDFDSRFSLHGAPYTRVGLYLDDILLHMPFHTVQGEGPSGSMTVFQADVVDQMSLQSEGYGPRYEGRTAGAMDIRTRDGGSQRSMRLTAGAADAGALAEGPLGQRGSWLAGVRKSYIQYLVKQTGDDPAMAFGFVDSQAQATYRAGAGSTLRLKLVDGTSAFDRSSARERLPLNTSMEAGYRFTVANLGWEWAPGGGFVMNTHGAFLRERYDDTNRDARTLSEGSSYGEWVGKADAAWSWSRSAVLEFGGSARRVRADGFADSVMRTLVANIRVRSAAWDRCAGIDQIGSSRRRQKRGSLGRIPPHSRDIRAEAANAHVKAISFEALAHGSQSVASAEGRLDFRPEHSQLRGFAPRLLIAEGGEAGRRRSRHRLQQGTAKVNRIQPYSTNYRLIQRIRHVSTGFNKSTSADLSANGAEVNPELVVEHKGGGTRERVFLCWRSFV